MAVAPAVERFNVSVPTAARWSRRYWELGEAGLQDRRSRVLGLRVNRRWGPARIAYHLHLNVSTVRRILARYLCPPLRFAAPVTGIRVRGRDRARRYEYAWPGEMIHVDVKKLGRIPNGGGHPSTGGCRAKGMPGPGTSLKAGPGTKARSAATHSCSTRWATIPVRLFRDPAGRAQGDRLGIRA